MTDKQRPVGAQIVDSFKSRLDAGVREQISNAQYSDLAQMIDAALSEEIRSAADTLDQAVKQLRRSARKTELEL